MRTIGGRTLRPPVGTFVALFVVGATILAACAPPAAPDLAGWHVLYTRPGWSGGAALDLRVVGDVSLARHVAARAGREGAEALLAEVRHLLAGDLALANLESPLAEGYAGAREGPYRLVAPPALAAALTSAGLDAVGLANNHGLDGGPAGLADTAAALGAAGIAPVGAGPGEAAALAPAVLEAAGLRVAVLAFNDVLDPADPAPALAPADDESWPSPDFAGCPAPGAACPYGRAWLSARALDAVAAARAEADVVVVMVHWGREYAAEPSARQRAWAARLVAAGADLVLGAHPHVLQPAGPLEAGGRSGFVAFSLGNFLFDAPADPALSGGAALRVLLDREGVALVAAAPVATAGGRPRPLALDGEAGRAGLATLGAPAIVEAPTAAPAADLTPRPPLPSGEDGPHGDTGEAPPAPAPATLTAWRWDGAQGLPVAAPAGLALPAPPARVAADLRGDGVPLWAELNPAGVVTVRDGAGPDAPVVWTNERPAWRFTRVIAGDPNDDGRAELLMLLWQPDEDGRPRSQPYLLGWRGGQFRVIWGGSATATPVQDLAWADLGRDGRGDLVVLEGGAAPGDPGEHVSLWRWHGWGFQLEWRSPPGRWSAVGLLDLDGDGEPEIVAAPAGP
ncbi:MAG TPA: CapA family protein [Chloroflexaceae bacterium]|nr:CapA family protein [Chloroflexaceae bacterium]